MSTQLLTELTLIGSVFLISCIAFRSFRKSNTTGSEKAEKLLTGLLGAFLTMAGMAKFFDPFTGMFTSQIAMSGLPFPLLARWVGQLGEILAGLLFLTALLASGRLSDTSAKHLIYGATLLTNIIMLVAIYVHLNPDVPAEVLPLQSKPPVLTLIVMFITGVNYYLYQNNRISINNNYSLSTGANK
ncbi:hypothetical protein [Vibrio sp. HN007]|uniref:hypothetical protein n=1 Tax=Vibrio iocasae TaxID=3098914 RepID=UPI0035D42F95